MGRREKRKFFRTCNKICRYFALPIILLSLVLVVIIVFEILNSTHSFLLESFPLIAGFFIGILNILTGLLLLTKE